MLERILSWLSLLAFIVITGYGIINVTGYLVFHDAAILQYTAWRIMNGAVPYRDLLEINMPGAYLLYMLPMYVQVSDLSLRLFDFAVSLLSAGIITAMGWRQSRFYACFAGLMFVAGHLADGAVNMMQRDFLLAPFLLLGACILRSWLKAPHRGSIMAVCGLSLGYAVWVKPVAALYLMLIGGSMLCHNASWRQRLSALAWLASGTVIPALLIHLWLYRLGGLGAFYDTLLHFIIPVYGAIHPADWPNDLISLSLTQVPVAFILLWLLNRSAVDKTDKTVLVTGLVYGLLHYYSQGKGWGYHLYPLWTFCALFIAMATPRLYFASEGGRMIFHSVILAMSVQWMPWSTRSEQLAAMQQAALPAGYIEAIAEDARLAIAAVPPALRKSYPAAVPDEAIQFFDYPVGILWNAAWRLHWITPLRYAYAFPFYYSRLPLPYVKQMQDDLLASLSRRPPLVIFLSPESWPYARGEVYRMMDAPPWKAWFAAHYTLYKETVRYRVYTRIQ